MDVAAVKALRRAGNASRAKIPDLVHEGVDRGVKRAAELRSHARNERVASLALSHDPHLAVAAAVVPRVVAAHAQR
jgi:hypothetical protein